MSDPRNVLAFVGENRNGILAVQSARFMELLRPYGYTGHVIDLCGDDVAQRLSGLLIEGVAFAWGYAGIGSTMGQSGGGKGGASQGGRNLWEAFKVPFVSVLADPPFWIPRNHHVGSGWVVNGYVYRDWLEFQRRFVRSPQVSGLVRMGVLPNPARDAIPWEARPVGMAYIKTGSDPEARRARWTEWPAPVRDALEDAASAALHQGTGDMVDIAIGAFDAAGLHLEARPEMLFGLLYELDLYLRAERATRIARALLPLEVEIHGDGWEHLEAEGARASFRPAFHAAKLDDVFARCRWLVNATPNFSSGAHERVLRGFAAGCAVVSDENDYSRERLAGMAAFRGIDWGMGCTSVALTEQLAAALADRSIGPDTLAEATRFVEDAFNPADFMQSVIDLADTARLRESFDAFSPVAA